MRPPVPLLLLAAGCRQPLYAVDLRLDQVHCGNSVGMEAVFDVSSAGARGDGVTDDTAAVQAALDAAGEAGFGIVYFPPGDFLLRPPAQGRPILRVPPRVRVWGYGREEVTLWVDADSPDYPSVFQGEDRLDGVAFCHLSLNQQGGYGPDADADTLAANPRAVLRADAGYELSLDDLGLVNLGGREGLWLGAELSQVHLQDVVVEDAGVAGSAWVHTTLQSAAGQVNLDESTFVARDAANAVAVQVTQGSWSADDVTWSGYPATVVMRPDGLSDLWMSHSAVDGTAQAVRLEAGAGSPIPPLLLIYQSELAVSAQAAPPSAVVGAQGGVVVADQRAEVDVIASLLTVDHQQGAASALILHAGQGTLTTYLAENTVRGSSGPCLSVSASDTNMDIGDLWLEGCGRTAGDPLQASAVHLQGGYHGRVHGLEIVDSLTTPSLRYGLVADGTCGGWCRQVGNTVDRAGDAFQQVFYTPTLMEEMRWKHYYSL